MEVFVVLHEQRVEADVAERALVDRVVAHELDERLTRAERVLEHENEWCNQRTHELLDQVDLRTAAASVAAPVFQCLREYCSCSVLRVAAI